MKRKTTRIAVLCAMALTMTFGTIADVSADYVPDYAQVFPESGYYYLTNFQTGEYMYYDPDASWKWIKCGDEEDADVWYIHGNSIDGYEIALAKNTDYILHFDGDADEDSELKIKPSSKMGDHKWTFFAWHDKYAAVHWFIAKLDDGIPFPDFNHTYLLYYDTPIFANDYVRLKRHSSDYGDYLFNGEVWYGIKTTYKKAIRSITPELSSVKATQKGDISVIKEKIKNKDLWKHIKNIEIQYTTDENFKNDVKTKVISKNTAINKTKLKARVQELKKGTTYYFRIRYTNGDNVRTEWSNVKKFKVKK